MEHIPSNNTIMHNRFIFLLFKITIPPTPKPLRWPAIHLLQLLLCRSHLDSRIDTIGSEGTGTFDVPFVEDGFLDFRNTSHEVVEGFGARFGSVDWGVLGIGFEIEVHGQGTKLVRGKRGGGCTRESQVMILEIQTHAWEINNRFHANLSQLLRITNT
jgi:hypothetical protein